MKLVKKMWCKLVHIYIHTIYSLSKCLIQSCGAWFSGRPEWLAARADTSPSPEPKEFAFDGVFGESSAMGLAWPSRLAREAKSHLNHWEIAREPSFISYFLLKFWSSQVEFIFSIFFFALPKSCFLTWEFCVSRYNVMFSCRLASLSCARRRAKRNWSIYD